MQQMTSRHTTGGRCVLWLFLSLLGHAAASARGPAPSPATAAAEAAAAAKAQASARAAARAHRVPHGITSHDLDVQMGSEDDRHPFDGIGALSAGASSRLLQDYPEEQRSEILDLLFKPRYAASIQVLKVEIGGDMQSTDGSEPSHMREADETPDCTRGYETWLMKEAKLRNPSIRIYGLAWGVPGWIGNGTFFSRDNIRYHVSWLQCIRAEYGFDVDYLGVWNEMPWGAVWYIDELVEEIRVQKLPTKLVLLDAIHGVDERFIKRFETNETFRGLVDAVGMHYPCESTPALAKALSKRKQTRFWASEEVSTVADWGGAGCWGRMINQNFVRMNATSSIAWSLIWSAYPNLECFGNGLLYAYEPWSGHYDMKPPVWTMAHTTQFTEVGWEYLPSGLGAGDLPGGGTFVTLVSPGMKDFTMVFETLEGQCFYHAGCFHTREADGPQRLNVRLDGTNGGLLAAALRSVSLEVWVTNRTHQFQRLDDVSPSKDGVVVLTLRPDTVMTVTTVHGASKLGNRGSHDNEGSDTGERHQVELLKLTKPRDPPSVTFPLPYTDSFERYSDGRSPQFFSDQGGAFEVVLGDGPASDVSKMKPLRVGSSAQLQPFHANKVLEQRVMRPPIAWIGHSPAPCTFVGGVNWTDISATVSARLGSPQVEGHAAHATASTNKSGAAVEAVRHAGLCVRISRYHFFAGAHGVPEGYCMTLTESPGPSWSLTAAGQSIAQGVLDSRAAQKAISGGWLQLRLEARGARIRAFVEGSEVANLIDTSFPFGQVALQCGYHRCQFDDLEIDQLDPAPLPKHRALISRLSLATFDYHARTCNPAPTLAGKRRDFTGFIGFAFTPKSPLFVEALGRLAVSGGHPWALVHNVSLYQFNASAGPPVPICSVALPATATGQVGIEETEDGWVFATFQNPVRLDAGSEYMLVSSELANGDAFYDKAIDVDVDGDINMSGPVYLDSAGGWHRFHEPRQAYGPLNAVLRAPTSSVKSTMASLRPLNDRLTALHVGRVDDSISAVNSLRIASNRADPSSVPAVPAGLEDSASFGHLVKLPAAHSQHLSQESHDSAATRFADPVAGLLIGIYTLMFSWC